MVWLAEATDVEVWEFAGANDYIVVSNTGLAVSVVDGATPELQVRSTSGPELVAEVLGRAGLWVSYLASDRQSLEAHYLELVGDQETAPWGR